MMMNYAFLLVTTTAACFSLGKISAATVECSIDVITFLCGTNEENNGFPIGVSYGLGQSFRICVDITEEYKDDYKLTGFESVICKNGLETREVVKDGDSDPLTTVETNVEGSSNLGGTLTASTNAVAVESVVTSGFFNSNGKDSSFDCSGEVNLEYIGEEGEDGCKLASPMTPPPSPSPPSGPPSRCIDLCNIEGNRGVAIPVGTDLQSLVGTYIADSGNTRETYGNDINCWNISLLTTLYEAFRDQSQFNEPLDCWDTKDITDMAAMFSDANSFNSDISTWNVESVTTMAWMFQGATSFNSDISAWNVNSVENMLYMFRYGTSFNSDISAWDVKSATSMQSMFYNAKAFNSDISGWDVSSVQKMASMFRGATSFNSDISAWNVNSVTDMLRMFYDARAFDQNLCDWKFPTIITNMFVSTSCDIQNNPTESAACQSCLESGRRRLGISNSINNNNNNNNKNNNRSNNRSLQESGGDTVAPFVTTIKFYSTVNEDSAAAPPLTILVVVVIGFISSLMSFFVIA